MRRVVPLLLLLAVLPAQARDHVLVVRADSPVADLDALTVRKLYLGFTVTVANRELRAVRLLENTEVNRAFMQNVIGMTTAQYESRLLRQVLKQGRQAPLKLGSADEVIAVLSRDPTAVGSLWADQVVSHDNLRVVRLLWRE